MSKNFKIVLLGLFVSLQAVAATEFNMTFTTAAPGGQYAQKNIVAVWVTTSGGTFVKTILRYAGTRKSDLSSWISAAGSSDADAVMGATRGNHATPTVMTATWDLKNKAGTVVPDGTYLIKFECADGSRQTYNYSFVKDSIAGTRTPAGTTYFKNISIVYAPPGPPNTPPVAQAQSVTNTEDTATAITLVATDVETNALTYAIVANPAHGTLSAVTSNRVTYTPTLNYNGADSFTFRAYDGTSYSSNATVSITLTPVNDAPIAQAQSVTNAEDTAKNITLVAIDPESNPITSYIIASSPLHGTLSGLTSNVVTYTPATNYYGPDSFTFRASDASLTGATATVSITVTSVNDAPVAQPQSVTTAEDTPKAITLLATDIETNALTYIIATSPTNGTLSVLTSNVVTYTPATNYNGPDSFTFRARDASLTSTPVTVSITVTPVNDGPIAQAQSVTNAEDTAKSITLVAIDPESDAITSYSIASSPLHGTLSGLTSNVVIYTPATNYYGPDSFTFRASDATMLGTPATVSITVTPVNDAPVAQVQSVSTAEDIAKVITLGATDIETNALTYAIVTNPTHGTLSGLTSNVVTYTPDLNYYGPDSFTFRASDASLTSTPATVSITVTSVNDAPVAQTQSVSTAEDTAKAITLVATDIETNALTYAIATNPSHGTLSGLTSNVVTYTPDLNYNGPDSFTFRASDASLTSTPVLVSITVTPVNDVPVAQTQSVSTAEDTAKAITLGASDPENDVLAYTIVSNPSHGVLSGLTSNVVTYTPDLNYNGPDSFTFRASDASLTSTPATVSITVTPVNDAPVPQAQSVSTAEDTPKAITLLATDIETNALTYAIATNPSHGTLSGLTSNVVTYTPDANYFGSDSFTFQSSDATLTGTPATVTITVTPVNDAPVAQVQSVTVGENAARVITLSAIDIETNALTYAIVTTPLHGTLSVVTSNKVTYTPALNYTGSDSFTFKANDGLLDSAPATVSLNVIVNNAPVAQSQSVTNVEDTVKSITLVATDIETNAMTYAIVSDPAHGTLSVLTSNVVTYIPAANYNGPDSFTFKANDGTKDSTEATVSITVTPVNDAPVPQAQSVTTAEDTATNIVLVAIDPDNDLLTYTIVASPTRGTLSGLTSNVVTYTPATNYFGTDSFTFRVRDASLTSTPVTVSITVTSVNDAPVAQTQSITTAEDTAKSITLVATDVETNSMTYAIATNPSHGTLSVLTSNVVTYTPDLNYNGPDSFTFQASDASRTSTPVTVTITVTPVNDVPVAQAQSVTTAEDIAKVITLVATDVETNALTYTIVTNPTRGTLSVLTSNVVTYTPATNYNGSDSFTFRVSDASLTSTPVTVSITVTPVNDAPVALAQSVTTAEDTAKVITLGATDVETNALTFAIVTQPSYGTLSVLTSNVVTYTPATNYFGPDSFTFQAGDASLTSTPATVSITVTSVNDTPVAQAQSVTTVEDTATNITLVATDVETNTLTYIIATTPLHGTLSGLTSNKVTYTPATNYYGSDSFTFRASDGSLTSTPATVSITVTPVNDAPVAQAQSVSVAENFSKIITMSAIDVDTNALTYAIVTTPSHGTLSVVLSNTVLYTPALNYTGPDSFTFKANDGSLDSAPATVSLNVIINNAPVAQSQSVTNAEDTAKSIRLVATDVETNTLTYVIVSEPSHGTLSGLTSNVVTYTPDANYNGPDTFTFKANDGMKDSNEAIVSITVTPVNDVPVAQAQSVTNAEDTATVITLVGTDVESSPLTYMISTNPSRGTLSILTSNVVTYTPATNYYGADSFTFRVSDGSLTSTPVTVSVTVTPVNDAPIAQAQNVTTAEDTAKAITLVATDVETNALTYVIITNPSHGIVSGLTSNVVTYTPDANYYGPDSFTFQASDASLTSTAVTVSITVTSVNDAPVAQAQGVTTVEDTAKAITLVATDVETNALTYAIVTNPSHGTLSGLTSNVVTYTPAANYNGTDSFTFRASDASLTSTPVTVSITITPVNDAPVAQAKSVSVLEDKAKVITLTATDPDNDPLTYTIETSPLNGVLSGLTSNVVTYVPATNYVGSDSFTFWVTDGSLTSTPATVSITVALSTNAFTLIFDPQGGTVDPTNMIVETGISLGELPTPIRSGYNFLGWYASYSNSAAQITSSTVINVRADKKIYAKWQAAAITEAGGPNGTNIFTIAVANGEGTIQCHNSTVSGSMTIPDRIPNAINGTPVTAIERYAFTNMTGLTNVVMPLFVSDISTFAFSNCTALVSATLIQPFDYQTGKYVSLNIGRMAFGYCTALKSILIPACTTNIGPRAFYQCSALEDIFFEAEFPPNVASNAFTLTALGGALNVHVPTGAATNYVGSVWANVNVRIVEDSNILAMRTALAVSLDTTVIGDVQLLATSSTQPIQFRIAVQSSNNLSAAQVMRMLLTNYPECLKVAYRPTMTDSWQLLTPDTSVNNLDGSATITVSVPSDAPQGFFKIIIQ